MAIKCGKLNPYQAINFGDRWVPACVYRWVCGLVVGVGAMPHFVALENVANLHSVHVTNAANLFCILFLFSVRESH